MQNLTFKNFKADPRPRGFDSLWDASMSLLHDHHIVSQKVIATNKLLQNLIRRGAFDPDGPKNRIYLPASKELAADMEMSAHGRQITPYDKVTTEQIQLASENAGREENAFLREFDILLDAMAIALANGDIFVIPTKGMTYEEASRRTESFNNYGTYARSHPAEMRVIQELVGRGEAVGNPDLRKLFPIIGNAKREKLLDEAIAKNPGVNLTAGNKGLRGTRWSAKFIEIDPIPHLNATPGLTPPNHEDFQPSEGLTPPSFDSVSRQEGFAQVDPRLTYGAPAFPAIDPQRQGLGQLPPTTALPSDDLVLQFNSETQQPMAFMSGAPVMGPPPSSVDQRALYGAALLGAGMAAVAAPQLVPLWLRVGAAAAAGGASAPAFAGTAGVNAKRADAAVFATASTPYNAFKSAEPALGTNSGGVDNDGQPPALLPRSTAASTFADRFGDWPETVAGSTRIQAPDAAGAPHSSSMDRRLTRVGAQSAANVFASGSSLAPVPNSPPPYFNDRWSDWATGPGNALPQQTSRPIGVFAGEPNHAAQPPIWGLHDYSINQGADEWLARWIRPFMQQDRVE